MKFYFSTKKFALFLFVGSFCFFSSISKAGSFQLNRYEPTAVGGWSFMVDQPWYSQSFDGPPRYWSAGLTLNYAYNPLVSFTEENGVIKRGVSMVQNHLLAHLNFSGSFKDRYLVSLSLPITLAETGNPRPGFTPIGGGAIGDPKLELLVRVFGQPYRDKFSVSAGGNIWLPFNAATKAFAPQVGEQNVKFGPKVVLSGVAFNRSMIWSFTNSFVYRQVSQIGLEDVFDSVQAHAGSEFILGGSIKYADWDRRFFVGPEVLYSVTTTGPTAGQRDGMSFEAMLTGHMTVLDCLNIGLGVGGGALSQAGTPNARVVLSIGYAPLPRRSVKVEPEPLPPPVSPAKSASDRDKDGIIDEEDQCPDAAGPVTNHGCPIPVSMSAKDTDKDGIPDELDKCPNEPGVASSDPLRHGCPALVIIEQNKNGAQLVVKKKVSLDSTFFVTGSARISKNKDTQQLLAEIARILRDEQPKLRVAINGHTDRRGSVVFNNRLSLQRATSIKNWLIKHGVSEERMLVNGYGSRQPKDTAHTLQAYKKNRRVEFVIINPDDIINR